MQGTIPGTETGGLFTIVSFTSDTLTVNANSGASVSIYATNTGYTPVAIAGITSFSSAFLLAEFSMSNSGLVNIVGHNVANGQISGAITVRVLFIKNM